MDLTMNVMSGIPKQVRSDVIASFQRSNTPRDIRELVVKSIDWNLESHG